MQNDYKGKFVTITSLFKQGGIDLYYTCPHIYKQNGFIECCYRMVGEKGLFVMCQECVP